METKSTTLTVRLKPSIKAMAVRLAKADHRSLADYLERLIDEAAKANSTSKRR
jgi:predicted HicB family RNase H-like nuclease